MIKVGINENLVVSKVEKNDKGTLVLTVKEATQIDPLAALNSAGSTNFTQGEKDFIIYPPKTENFDGDTDTYQNILKKIAEIKDPLDLILRQYTTTANIKWDIFAGTAVNGQTITTELLKQSTLDKIYNNIAEQFIKMMTPFVGEEGKKMRWLFTRQSKTKHYPSLRRKFLETYPFIEPMDVPASKLKFSDYEVKNGLNNGEAAGGAETPSTEEKEHVNTLFTAN